MSKKTRTASEILEEQRLGLSPEQVWQDVDGDWIANADDGKGYHDGDGKYTVHVRVADFGQKYLPGGEARFTSSLEYQFPLFSTREQGRLRQTVPPTAWASPAPL